MPTPFKPNGPKGANRPFMPVIGDTDPAERIAHALEHIAVALSAIDHNLEALTTNISSIAHVLPKLTKSP